MEPKVLDKTFCDLVEMAAVAPRYERAYNELLALLNDVDKVRARLAELESKAASEDAA